jgi:hypothetical protein
VPESPRWLGIITQIAAGRARPGIASPYNAEVDFKLASNYRPQVDQGRAISALASEVVASVIAAKPGTCTEVEIPG